VTRKKAADNTPTPGFDDSLSQLEKLVSTMEDGKLSLEEALSTFEAGIRLTRECQQALDQAELKVRILTTPDGEPEAMTDMVNTDNIEGSQE
jgi:exodeoxyribonuclease VII small subunit